MKSYVCSNLDRPFKIQRPTLLPYSADRNRGSGRVAPWPAVKELGSVHGALIFDPTLPT
jgi:hypothetical protein